MNRTLTASIFVSSLLLAACQDSSNTNQSTSAASAPAAESSAGEPEAASTPVEASVAAADMSGGVTFQVLGNNQAVLKKYEMQKTDAESMLDDVQSAVAGNQAALAYYRRESSSPQVEAQSQKLQALSDQAEQKFGVGIMSPPLGECGALASAAADFWREQIGARAESRKADPDYKNIYQDSVKSCREAIDQPPPAEVTIKLKRGAPAPAEGCRKLPEFASSGEAIESNKMVCPADAIAALQ